MENGILWQSLGIIICLVLSGFFSASETAFTSLNRIRMKNKAMNGDRRAERALKLADRYDALLSTILIGNNIVNIVSASLGTLAFTTLLGPAVGVPVSTAVITIAVLIFGEISPKSLAKEHAEGLAMTFAPALSLTPDATKNNIPSVRYATIYPLTLFLRVMAAQWMVLLLS